MFHKVLVLTPVTASSLRACTFRSPPEAEEGAGVFGAAGRAAGDPLVIQVQHFRGACSLCGAAPLELWHPPEWGRRYRVGDCGSGKNQRTNTLKYDGWCSKVPSELMWVIPLIRHLRHRVRCPSMPHATSVKVLHMVAHSLHLWRLWKFQQRETHRWLMWQHTHMGLRPCVNPDPLWFNPLPICPPLDGRGAHPTGWHQSQQMVPVQSGCSQRARDPRLHCTQQTLPLL